LSITRPGKDDRMTQSNRTNVKGQAGVLALVVVGFTLFFSAMPASSEKEKNAVIKHEGVEIIADFYGERMAVPSQPEHAFKISVENGQIYVSRYEEEGIEKADSSLYSYGFFDLAYPDRLVIYLYNDSCLPFEMDYANGRYYVESYGGYIYQLKINTGLSQYEKVLNPGERSILILGYPSSLSVADIKNIVIRLGKNDIVIGLLRIPW